ncbi:hypothetical protein FGB62_4g448 [Gracilaria domingensis]|nr:hypothetical protein FGB62_4g448 [Gracilaria domingensis]
MVVILGALQLFHDVIDNGFKQVVLTGGCEGADTGDCPLADQRVLGGHLLKERRGLDEDVGGIGERIEIGYRRDETRDDQVNDGDGVGASGGELVENGLQGEGGHIAHGLETVGGGALGFGLGGLQKMVEQLVDDVGRVVWVDVEREIREALGGQRLHLGVGVPEQLEHGLGQAALGVVIGADGGGLQLREQIGGGHVAVVGVGAVHLVQDGANGEGGRRHGAGGGGWLCAALREVRRVRAGAAAVERRGVHGKTDA